MRRGGVVVLAFASAACAAIAGIDAPFDRVEDGGSTPGVDASDAPSIDDWTSEPTPGDAAVEATSFNSLTDPASWQAYDLDSVDKLSGFIGCAFDGRFVYFAPTYSGSAIGVVARYDNTGAFGAASSWNTFDATKLLPGAKGLIGAAFDGRYVYFVPFNNGNPDGIVVRYDSEGSFTATGSWETFDTTTVNASASGFEGATFDGRYLYLVPFDNGAYDGVVARYDTSASGPFASSVAAWVTFDTTEVDPNALGFTGAVFDGRYVYLVPSNHGVPSALVARYDTTGAFTSAGAWSTFDTNTVNPGARGFAGAAFDGRYVYLVPSFDGASYSGVVVRYDNKSDFATPASWTAFDTTTLLPTAKGFFGAAFDGRYVYFVPYYDGAPDGWLVRYDTTAEFASLGSWGYFDTSQINVDAIAFAGAAFDGQYLYLVPTGHTAVRFDAKTPASVPQLPAWSGSFF